METKDKKAAGDGAEHASSGATNGATMPRPPAAPKAAPNGATPAHANGTSTSSTDGPSSAPEPDHTAHSAGLVVSHDYSPALQPSDVSAWLTAYDAIQARTAEAHAIYQQTMAQCHLAFLQNAEQAALALASLASGAPLASHAALEQRPAQWTAPKAPVRRQVAPAVALGSLAQAVVAPAARPVPSPVKRLDAPASRAPAVVPPPATSAPVPRTNGTSPAKAATVAVVPPMPTRPAAPPPGLQPAAAPPPAVAPAADARPKSNGGLVLPADGDLKSFLFGIVADKTGYPVDILSLDQQLEADLGIDSIKRVEILSAFEGQIQNIQDINLEEVAKLNTLRDVLGFMERYADKLGLEKKK